MLLDLTEYTQPLSRTPAVLRAVIEGRPDAWLDSRHAPDVVSPREAVAHLVLCDRQSWVLRIKRVLESEQVATLPPFALMDEGEILKTQTVQDLMTEFKSLRAQRIRDLEDLGLSSSDMQKQGIHTLYGPFKVEQLLSTWVAHDLYHLGQIFKSYSAVYVDRIGP